MRITTWTEYSLIISSHLARRIVSGSQPVAARELAESERLPADYVEQILLRLRRAGLVESVRGAKGGYLLARPASDITVHDVMSASEHQTFEVNCDTPPHRRRPMRARGELQHPPGLAGGAATGRQPAQEHHPGHLLGAESEVAELVELNVGAQAF